MAQAFVFLGSVLEKVIDLTLDDGKKTWHCDRRNVSTKFISQESVDSHTGRAPENEHRPSHEAPKEESPRIVLPGDHNRPLGCRTVAVQLLASQQSVLAKGTGRHPDGLAGSSL